MILGLYLHAQELTSTRRTNGPGHCVEILSRVQWPGFPIAGQRMRRQLYTWLTSV